MESAPTSPERSGRELISVVVPLYNEALNLAHLASDLKSTLDPLGVAYEVVFIDDGSIDETWATLRQLAAQSPAWRGLRLSRNFGKEAALTAGLDAARGAAVITMDGDLQHPPSLIPEMIRKWREDGAEIVEAVKTDRGKESLASRVRARAFYRVLRSLSGLNLDGTSDFQLLDRKVVREFCKLHEYNRFFRGMVVWLGFRHARVPFSVHERTAGRSGWSLLQLIRLAVHAITSSSTLPLHFSTLSGVAFAVIAFFLGVQTLYVKLSGQSVPGFTTVILLLLIIGSAVLLSVGIIGEYVARIYHEVKRRPTYVVSDSVGDAGQGELPLHGR